MKIKPIYTEKTMNQARNGQYSFVFSPKLTKNQIKALIETAFKVKIKDIKSLNSKENKQKNVRGRIKTTKAVKKVLVTLKSGKIELFEQTKK